MSTGRARRLNVRFTSQSKRIPASWLRFLWFMTCLGIACFSLIAGQGELESSGSRQLADLKAYASLYLSTLPHTSLDAGTWVYSWVISELTTPLLVGA